eukprot:TRINITY_DN19332_c0_g1_i1.p1 TRINITY_DN19332_c0_g1~~TRINITY_DN19332_c0_g1_i1.p1  ORF type:complete len:353 (-),score=67.81 TRINITY_DN19332_c0_g1_i1:24-986(-)
MKEALGSLTSSPYLDDVAEEFVLDSYAKCVGVLPRDVLREVLRMRDSPDPELPGALYITNMPTDDEIPINPATEKERRGVPAKGTFVSEGCLVGISRLLGEAFVPQQLGLKLVQQVCPLSEDAECVLDTGCKLDLPLHQDASFVQEPPHYLLLYCIRGCASKEEGHTLYADNRDICDLLTAEEKEVLRRPIYKIIPGRVRGVDVLPRPILRGEEGRPQIQVGFHNRIEVEHEDPLVVEQGKKAVGVLQENAKKCVQEVHLDAGELLIIDNRMGLHGRSAFSTTFSGQDRWLQRLYAVESSFWKTYCKDKHCTYPQRIVHC